MAKKPCSECGGNGQVSLIVECSNCKGSGEVIEPDGTVKECPSCIFGHARVYATCPKCDGTGEA